MWSRQRRVDSPEPSGARWKRVRSTRRAVNLARKRWAKSNWTETSSSSVESQFVISSARLKLCARRLSASTRSTRITAPWPDRFVLRLSFKPHSSWWRSNDHFGRDSRSFETGGIQFEAKIPEHPFVHHPVHSVPSRRFDTFHRFSRISAGSDLAAENQGWRQGPGFRTSLCRRKERESFGLRRPQRAD
jgi:hypothetical protein